MDLDVRVCVIWCLVRLIKEVIQDQMKLLILYRIQNIDSIYFWKRSYLDQPIRLRILLSQIKLLNQPFSSVFLLIFWFQLFSDPFLNISNLSLTPRNSAEFYGFLAPRQDFRLENEAPVFVMLGGLLPPQVKGGGGWNNSYKSWP